MVSQAQIQKVGLPRRTLKDIISEEHKRCAMEPKYFINRYCKIQHPMKGKIAFEMFDFQERVLQEFRDNRFNIVLKARQLGLSTLVAAYSLWLMLFHTDKNILVIATKQSVAKNLVTKVRIMHQNLPIWLKGNCVEDNRLSLSFANGSQIKAESSAKQAGRSEALSLLVLDEAAFIKDVDSIWAASSLTLSTGGSAIILSTPNGIGNFFHKTWQAAEEGVNISGGLINLVFNSIKLLWNVHPEHDRKWRDQQDELLGLRLASQECDCDFVTSGNTVIEGEILKWYSDTLVKDPIEKEGIDRNLWIWEYPNYTKSYVVAADVSRGDGSDYSAFQIIDVESLQQVAEYKSKVGTGDFGNLLVEVATKYNDALLVIENSNMGWAVVQKAIERKYKNLLYSSADMMKVDVESQIKRQWDYRDHINTDKLIAGVTMGPTIRGLVVSKIDEYFRTKEMKCVSKRCIGELFTWIWKNGRADHSDGYNDDTIFALGIALLIRDTALKLRQRGIDLQKKAIEGITRSQLPPIYMPQRLSHNPWNLPVRGVDESLEWLIDKHRIKSGSLEHSSSLAEKSIEIEPPPMPVIRG